MSSLLIGLKLYLPGACPQLANLQIYTAKPRPGEILSLAKRVKGLFRNLCFYLGVHSKKQAVLTCAWLGLVGRFIHSPPTCTNCLVSTGTAPGTGEATDQVLGKLTSLVVAGGTEKHSM